MTDMSERKWLTLNEAADYLRLSPKTLRNRRCNGLPPKSKKSAGKVVYDRIELERFVEHSDRPNA